MPLAADATGLEEGRKLAERREAALGLLAQTLTGDLITGEMFDQVEGLLSADPPDPREIELMEFVEALADGTQRSQKALQLYLESRVAESPSGPSEGEPLIEHIADIEFAWRYIPPGTFQMGSRQTEVGRKDDELLHEVRLTRGFWMGETEVTQGQFEEFVRETGYETEAEREGWSSTWARITWKKKPGATWRDSGGRDHPVVNVSWNDAKAFCEWLSDRSGKVIRLATEAEWEYAARANTTTPFWTGENLTTDQANYNGNFPYAGHAKGQFRQKAVAVRSFDANPWGLYEVHGNVGEWTEDAVGFAQRKVVLPGTYVDGVEDPFGTRGSNRVLRGGGWISYGPHCRAAFRFAFEPGSRADNLGFRLVKTLP